MNLQLFKADAPQADLDDLSERLARTRWPDQLEGADWRLGTERDFLQKLCTHWGNAFT